MEFPLQIVEVISFYFVRNAILWNLWVPSWGTVNIASDICFEIKSWTQPAFWYAFQKSCGTHMWAIVVRIPRMLQIFTQSWFYLSPSNQMIKLISISRRQNHHHHQPPRQDCQIGHFWGQIQVTNRFLGPHSGLTGWPFLWPKWSHKQIICGLRPPQFVVAEGHNIFWGHREAIHGLRPSQFVVAKGHTFENSQVWEILTTLSPLLRMTMFYCNVFYDK